MSNITFCLSVTIVVMSGRRKMKSDKSRIEEHKECATCVVDDSLKGKKIDAIDKRAGLDWEDQGIAKVPQGAKTLYVGDHRWSTAKFRKKYDEIAWECAKCGKMHLKAEKCD
jgi:hypothetical protein